MDQSATVLFDVDGTLVDSGYRHTLAWTGRPAKHSEVPRTDTLTRIGRQVASPPARSGPVPCDRSVSSAPGRLSVLDFHGNPSSSVAHRAPLFRR